MTGRRRRAMHLMALCVVLVTELGCASTHSRTRMRDPARSTTPILLHIQSRHWRAVDVFLLLGSARSKIGRVEALASATLPLAAHHAGGSLQLALRPMGSARVFATRRVIIGERKQIDLTVCSWLAESFLASR